MSRGKGWVQNKIIELLGQQERIDSFKLTAEVYDVTPDETGWRWLSQSQLASVRRALYRLQDAGDAYMIHLGHPRGRSYWALPDAAFRYVDQTTRMGCARYLPKRLKEARAAQLAAEYNERKQQAQTADAESDKPAGASA
jgi:hypothetical protein